MGAEDSTGYGADDPKHPDYAERAYERADLERKRARESAPGAHDSDRWWPAGLPEWIGEQAEAGDELFVALDEGLRSFGWPAYNVPLPHEDSWPGLALALAQRIRGGA